MTQNNTSKKSIGSSKKSSSKVTIIDRTPAPVDVTQVVAAPVVEQTVSMEKENTMNTTPVTNVVITGAESPALTTPKKKGGLTKEQRAERAREMQEIRARLVATSTSEFRNGTMSPGDFAQVMLDMESKVEEEYKKLHPKKVASRTGNGPQKGSPESLARFVVGRFILKVNQKRETPLTREEAIALLTYGVDNQKVGKRTKKA